MRLFRVRWQREGGSANRSKRRDTYERAARFVDLLLDEDSQEEWGEIIWVVIEVAHGTIGPWKEARP